MAESTAQILEKQGFSFRNWTGSEELANEFGISNAVIIPANTRRVIVGGQIGFRDDGTVPTDIEEEVRLAFGRVTRSLQACGLGEDAWQYVYSVSPSGIVHLS